MKIVIHYGGAEWPLETDQPAPDNLDDLIDTFGHGDVRRILDEGLRTFRELHELLKAEEA